MPIEKKKERETKKMEKNRRMRDVELAGEMKKRKTGCIGRGEGGKIM